MPLQNRVSPSGDIIATPARGLFMGNRGRLHNEHRILRRQFSHERRWLICKAEFKGRKRTPMTPGHYTELFFLDEATALAAGHRPCAECRFADYQRFKRLWKPVAQKTAGQKNARQKPATGRVTAERIDLQLQAERMNADGTKRRFRAAWRHLPDGVFVTLDANSGPFLLWNRALHRWTPHGYDRREPIPAGASVDVLTPRSTVSVIAAGYVPIVHPSASNALTNPPVA